MPQIVIDGQTFEAREGQTIIDVALENGIEIPHFCWHPALTVAGNCRMCLVDVGMPKRNREGQVEVDENGNPVIGFLPKMQIACATTVADGMHVLVNNRKVENAQEAVMEFLLINHPLDCPICDEAGQCKLQDYAFRHSRGESRFEEEKVHKDKRVPLGPNVMFDAERCISCSRCIRFAAEVAEQPVLSFVQRGDHVTIETFPGQEFDSPYSMNVIDICPVGALTSSDFRFRARVWDMSFNDSVCTGCARGCNTKAGVRYNEILRLDPRTNMNVNEYWTCDYGRLTQYPFVNNNRIDRPMVRTGDGSLTEVNWDQAIKAAAGLLKGIRPEEIMVVGSARATNEDNYLLAKFARTVLKTNNIDFIRHENPAFADDLLRRSDMTPNTAGALAVGITPGNSGTAVSTIAAAVNSGKIKAMYIMEEDLASLSGDAAAVLDKLNVLIVHSSNHTATTERAHIVFSAATYAELEGTYTNFQKRVQHVSPALVTVENERFMGMKMSRLDKFGAHNDRWAHGPRRHCRQSWRVLQLLAGALGTTWQYKRSEDVFREITEKVEGFQGMTYHAVVSRGGIVLGRAGETAEEVFEYDSHVLKPH